MSTAAPLSFAPAGAHSAYDYAVVDVFAEQPLQGNALAVFADARGLTTGEMQAIAREMNLSETTFILPREQAIERERGVQVRIFTVREELPFAGHPTLGTATWIYLNHSIFAGSQTITLDLAAGRVPVTFDAEQSGPGIFGRMRQADPTFGRVHDREAVAQALGLNVADLDPELPIETVSTGVPFCIVPLRSLEVAARLAVPQHAAQRYLAGSDAKFFFCMARANPASGAGWHNRMQFYNGEDPATGSASGCAIAYLVRHGAERGDTPVVFEQGVEMDRPSRIHVQASSTGTRIENVFVGGRTIPIATGRLFLP
jgi:trans-2,3-dihydro-3-hydroxyanthranilate isomerase